uniref:Mitogen-activated protein kinase binding protein 1 n=1 Tax=Ornithorhynchus anatinus TaxID=9258 RepID=F6PMJ4_ORNAN
MAVDGPTITSRLKNLLRSPSIKLRRTKASGRREDLASRVCGRAVQSPEAQTTAHPQQLQEDHHRPGLLPR